MSLLLLVLLAGSAAGVDVAGGHAEPPADEGAAAADARRALLEEMWQRRILPPDQKMWSTDDYELLERIRRPSPTPGAAEAAGPAAPGPGRQAPRRSLSGAPRRPRKATRGIYPC